MQWVLAWGVILGTVVGMGQEAVDYVRDVKPILERRCVSCHGRLKQKAGLRLDVGTLIHKGGGKGSVIEVGRGDASALVKRLVTEDESERMPPESKPLPAEQVRLIARWIDQGARVPKDEVVPAGPGEHWSFQTIRRPRVPEVRDRSWVVNPVDAFVSVRVITRFAGLLRLEWSRRWRA